MTGPLITSLRLRQRAVHGWSFEDLTTEEVKRVRQFLASGEVNVLPGRYRHYAEDVAAREARTT